MKIRKSGVGRTFEALNIGLLGLVLCITSEAQPVEDLRIKTSETPLGIQEDGKILVGGMLDRLLPDGTRDTAFNGELGRYPAVESILIREDGRIVVGGRNRNPENALVGVARILPDGEWDRGFSPVTPAWLLPGLFPGPGVASDQKFFVLHMMALRPFNANGTPDLSFQSAVSHVGTVLPLADGKILVQEMDERRPYRLLPDGSIDTGFNSDLVGSVGAFTVQPDGKILVSGWDFNSAQGDWSARGLVRLQPDGALDRSFKAGVDANGIIKDLALQADGKIIVSGQFTTLGGGSCANLGRLHPDGTLDMPLVTPYGSTEHLILQKDGRLLMRGNIHIPNAADTNVVNLDSYLVRLANLGTATETLAMSGDAITWLRGGTSPEVWRTVFHVSTNGRDWTRLGDGERIAGGWKLSGVALPEDSTIRARGFVIGARNGVLCPSEWYVESLTGAPVITRDPTNRTNDAGTAAVFTAWGGATSPFSFRWQKSGVPLNDGLNISGAATSILTVSNVLAADAGDYAFVVSNSSGSVTSSIATLTVREPILTAQPVSQDVYGGETISLSVNVVGTEPITYIWRRDGVALPVPSSPSLQIQNAGPEHMGSYDVVVSNSFGVASSASASVTVHTARPDSFLARFIDSSGVAVMAELIGRGTLMGGCFNHVNGEQRRSLALFDHGGALDPSFVPGAFGLDMPQLTALAVQPDGRLLVAGGYSVDYRWSGPLLNRLETDGRVDTLFDPVPGRINTPDYAIRVSSVLCLPDRRTVVGGTFDTFDGEPRRNLVRLHPSGAIDPTFNAAGVEGGGVYCLAAQPDGKILVGGAISNLLVRLHPDGDLDTTFHPVPTGDYIEALVVQPDGRILVGGHYSSLAGEPCRNLGRLNPDGTLDASFAPFIFGGVRSIALQANGKIIVAPDNYPDVNAVRRLNPDGTPDPGFLAFADSAITSLALQSDGSVLVGGLFSRLAGQDRPDVARLLNTDAPAQSLSANGTLITWLRGGSSPEVWRTTFEVSTDGLNWTLLGDGKRIPGGWTLTGVTVPQNADIRARGFTTGGGGNNSSWFVESHTSSSPTRPLIQPSGAKYKLEAGKLRFKVDGPIGRAVIIESSADLRQWQPMATNQVPIGGIEFSDPEDSNADSKYYRARLQ